MKKIKLLSLCVSVGFFMACAGGAGIIVKETLGNGENLAVEVEHIAFRKELIITSLDDGKMKFVMSPSLLDNRFAREVTAAFKKKFSEALQERGVRVISGAPVKLQIAIAQGYKRVILSRVSILAVYVQFIKENKIINDRFAIVSSAEVYSLPVTNYERLTEQLAEISANDAVAQFRAKKIWE